MNKIKIGFLVDSLNVSKYDFEIINWVNSCDKFERPILIKQEILPINILEAFAKFIKNKGFLSLFDKVLFILLINLENIFLKKYINHRNHLKKFRLDNIFKVIEVRPIKSKNNLIFTYSDDDINKIRSNCLDVVIRMGSGILRGDILNVAKHGVLSFHHGDNTKYRGGPPGFWEVYFKESSTGFVIQRLNNELDGGDVISFGEFATKPFYLLNQANVCLKSNFYMKRLLLRLSDNNEPLSVRERFPYSSKLFKRPNSIYLLSYFYKFIIYFSKKIFDRFIINRRIRWSVAFQFRDWKNLVLWRSLKIANRPYHFLADPFVVKFEGSNFCFVEDYNYHNKKASIGLYSLNDAGATHHGDVISENFHLSFPYIFNYDGKYYMVPESSTNMDIRIYESTKFPHEWRFLKIIMSAVSAADSMIFYKDGLWWLFTNIDPSNIGDHSSELFIFYSDNPLSTNWIAHAENPVICSSLSARNAGIIIDNECIYRVAQSQGFDFYGKSISINKIICLTANRYVEESMGEISPNFSSNISGIHHLHSCSDISVFDTVNVTRVSS